MSYTLFRGFVSAFFGLSVCQSVGPSIGPLVGFPAGPSIGRMHRCLPVRLFLMFEPEKQVQIPFIFIAETSSRPKKKKKYSFSFCREEEKVLLSDLQFGSFVCESRGRQVFRRRSEQEPIG